MAKTAQEVGAESPTRRRVREMSKAGLSPREIALALGVSTQAVYKHLARIRQTEQAKTA